MAKVIISVITTLILYPIFYQIVKRTDLTYKIFNNLLKIKKSKSQINIIIIVMVILYELFQSYLPSISILNSPINFFSLSILAFFFSLLSGVKE